MAVLLPEQHGDSTHMAELLPTTSPAPQFSFIQPAPCKVQLEGRSFQQNFPAWELPAGTGVDWCQTSCSLL